MELQKQKKEKQLANSSPLTIGQILNGWVGLTRQDEKEFESKVSPKIRALLIKHYKATGHLGFTDSQAYENPESVFDFMTDLFNVLIEATPEDKKNSLVEQIKTALITSSTESDVEIDSELLHDASAMTTSEIAAKLSGALSNNPSAKDRIIHPLVSELMAMEAKKYGWDSVVSTNHNAQLQSVLSQNGVSSSKRMMSRSLKRMRRRNILQNIDDALEGKLIDKLKKIISEQTAIEQDRVQSIWEFPSDPPSAESVKTICEWLFRRSDNDTGRNH